MVTFAETAEKLSAIAADRGDYDQVLSLPTRRVNEEHRTS